MSKLVMKQERTPKGHWYGYFAGANKSVVVEGSLASTSDEAVEYVNKHEFNSEADSEREVTNSEGEKTIVKGKTYFYGEFASEGYKSFDVAKLRGRKTATVEIEYLD